MLGALAGQRDEVVFSPEKSADAVISEPRAKPLSQHLAA